MNLLTWIGIIFCISQSAMFSGLNLAFFSISKLRLEIEAGKNNKHAIKIAQLREDSNFLLTTILWGNVGINVLLTLLSNSIMAGVIAFVFSTIVITFLGEIVPQAYFSRHAMQMASLLSPILRLYQFILYPFAKPTSLVLDKWLGTESIPFFREKDIRELLKLHMAAPETDLEKVEATGALNFLALDDLSIVDEGEPIDPESIIELPFRDNKPVFPVTSRSCDDPFLKRIQASGKKWVILTDTTGEPRLALDADSFLRSMLSGGAEFNPMTACHRPIIFSDPQTLLGKAIVRLKVYPERFGDDVIDDDIILFWGDAQRRVITGSDVLGRLLRGIAQVEERAHRQTVHSKP